MFGQRLRSAGFLDFSIAIRRQQMGELCEWFGDAHQAALARRVLASGAAERRRMLRDFYVGRDTRLGKVFIGERTGEDGRREGEEEGGGGTGEEERRRRKTKTRRLAVAKTRAKKSLDRRKFICD